VKKFTPLFSVTLLALLTLHQLTFAQAQRLVLVEEFTQASCGPCASQNPGFNDLLNQNPDLVRSIKYQVSWPGYDPMYLQNPAQVDSRVSYYGVNSVPWGWMDGVSIINDCNAYTGAPACLSQSDIDNESAVSSPFTLSLSHTLSPNADSIYITLDITAVGTVSGTIKARIAVVEQEIDFTVAPGSNGETVFENVMKQMLPNTSGTLLPSTIDVGYTNTITQKWKLANIYNLNRLAVIAWIQNDAGKAVYQAAYSDPLPALTNCANITSLSVPSSMSCTGLVTPKVSLKNLGTTTLTNATISSAVGSGTVSIHDWAGSLAPGASISNVQLEATAVPPAVNSLHAWVSNINGTSFNSSGMVTPVLPTMLGFNAAVTTPISADFTSVAFPPAGWFINNPNSSSTWFRYPLVGAYQNMPYGSIDYPFFAVAAGDVDDLYTQNFDFSDVSQQQSYLEFDYAKAKRTGKSDALKIFASSDCGSTWTTLFNKSDNSSLSTTTSTLNWKPTDSSQWKKEVISMNQFLGQSNVLVKFQAVSGNGDNLYIDNINIHYGNPVGIAEPSTSSMMLYPNPANEEAVVHVDGIVSQQTELEVVNILGQVIYSTNAKSNSDLIINTSQFETGMYVYRLNDNGKILAMDKFNVSH